MGGNTKGKVIQIRTQSTGQPLKQLLHQRMEREIRECFPLIDRDDTQGKRQRAVHRAVTEHAGPFKDRVSKVLKRNDGKIHPTAMELIMGAARDHIHLTELIGALRTLVVRSRYEIGEENGAVFNRLADAVQRGMDRST